MVSILFMAFFINARYSVRAMIKHIGASWLMTVALPALVLLGSGCTSPSEKPAEKTNEKISEATSGDEVKVDVKGQDGSPAIGGGSSRPESAPADLPSVEGAVNFTWINLSGSGVLAYEVPGNDYKKVCAGQIDLLLKAGWQKSDAYEMDVEKLMIKFMSKLGFALSITCADSTDEGSTDFKTGVTLNTSKS